MHRSSVRECVVEALYPCDLCDLRAFGRPPDAYHAEVGVRERGDQFRRLARTAIADLFDQTRAFGRLALTHVLMTAGDTLFAVSLAGSLFFSISPTEAKDKVLLYLLLTMGPFAVVAPALSPLIDRSRGARRAMVVTSALGRAVLCPFVARDLHSLLLFPEAFLMLVLSKVYVVTKGALVPEIAALDAGTLGGAGVEGAATDGGTHDGGDQDRGGQDPSSYPSERRDSTPPYGTPVIDVESRTDGAPTREPDLATLNARLGLLAALSGIVFALPAVGIFKIFGSPGVLWTDMVVFAAAAFAGARLPVRRLREQRRKERRPSAAKAKVSAEEVRYAPDLEDVWAGDAEDLAAFRPFAGRQVLLALMPMSVLKALLGFLTFLLAFGLRREDAATWWFGLLLGSMTAGALIGVLLVGRIRRVFSEQQILTGCLWLVAAAATLGALVHARLFQAVVALAVGVAGSAAKPSFDALVQRNVRELDQGRAFGRFETQLQLMWVVGSLVPVVLSLPVPAGNAVMAASAALAALSYMSSLRALRGETALGRR
jgi:Major Facilitator Superfamily